jgi:GNAT superfamily N-acetyltransferase
MSVVEVRQVSADEVLTVRWPVLRPGFPREAAVFVGDDAPGTRHFGAFIDGRLVGVASTYIAPMPGRSELAADARQLRGMATLPEFQGRGAGRAVLAACEAHARAEGAAIIWCNARTSAADFYSRHGWQISGEEFDLPTVGPHYVMSRPLIQ